MTVSMGLHRRTGASMTGPNIITNDTVGDRLTWAGVTEAIAAGHRLPKAQIGDQFLHRAPDTMLSRAAWIDGLGFGVKSVSVMPANPALGRPTVHGVMVVFDDSTGEVAAVIDSGLLTAWKTAGDSAFGARTLARPDAAHYLIIGAGVVAETLVRAFSAIIGSLTTIEIWNRTPETASALAAKLAAEDYPVSATPDLPAACARADIISTATLTQTPILKGAWVRPGTHVDLIGAFKPDMREADDALLQKAHLFVDSKDTTLGHIGELMIPLATGAITESDVLADYYDLAKGRPGRTSDDEITVLKNGGGAHLDLMTAHYILSAL